jgi:hypothetical protein
MNLPIFVVDAFASEVRSAGIRRPWCSGHGDDEAEWMQLVAAEMKHSETAFVRQRADGDFDLRWFTPEVEVDLCGHATLASAHVLFETGRLAPTRRRASTPAAACSAPATPATLGITLDFPVAEPGPTRPMPGARRRARARGRGRVAPHRPARSSCAWSSPTRDGARPRARLRRAAARSRRARRLRHRAGDDGGYDIVSRCFAPRRHRRGPGHGVDALRPRRVLGRPARQATSCTRSRPRPAAARCVVSAAIVPCSRAGPRPCSPVRVYARVRGATRAARDAVAQRHLGAPSRAARRPVRSNRRCGTRRRPAAC